MIRKLLTIIMTLLVLTGLSFGVAYFTHSNFIDCSGFIGIGAIIAIWFFTSKNDGYVTRRLDLSIQGSTGIRIEDKRFEFSSNTAFLTSVAYTIITIAAILYHYRSYF